MYLLLIIVAAICILRIIISTIYVIENADDLVDQSITLLISLLVIIIFCFSINVAYKEFKAENKSGTAPNNSISEQVSNKDYNISKARLSVDNPSNNTHIQVNYEVSIYNQCENEVNHEHNSVTNISKEHPHKEGIVSEKESNSKRYVSICKTILYILLITMVISIIISR